MDQSLEAHHHHSHRFPVLLFFTTTGVQTALAFGIFKLVAPSVLANECSRPWMVLLLTALFGVPLSLFEYLYHRYLLHSAVLPFLGKMHKSHRDHHDLTSVKAPVRKDEPQQLVPVKSEYPVEHEEQEENMMFPSYALSIFFAIFTVVFALPLKLILPSSPAFTALLLSVVLYYSGYELWHAMTHLPFEKYWGPWMENPRTKRLVKFIYSFHLMHHWRPTVNVAVVGLWGVAVWDHAFRTHHRPGRAPLQGAEVSYEDARIRQPLWPVSQLDRWQPAMYQWSRNVERKTLSLFTRRAA